MKKDGERGRKTKREGKKDLCVCVRERERDRERGRERGREVER